jgi:sulfite reductase (NADPH) flavoprotein alpha-component
LRNLHRKLLLPGDAGRIAVGIAAVLMLFVALSGLALLAHRMGGWRRLPGAIRGNALQRLHDKTARAAIVLLALSATTGMLMSLSTFGLLPEGGGAQPYFDVQPGGSVPMPLERMAALRSIEVSRLVQLKLAGAGDPTDAIEVETSDGTGMIDPATGHWLAWAPLDGWQRLHATVKMLHTGEAFGGSASCSAPLRSRFRCSPARASCCGCSGEKVGRAWRAISPLAKRTRCCSSAAKATSRGALPARCTRR